MNCRACGSGSVRMGGRKRLAKAGVSVARVRCLDCDANAYDRPPRLSLADWIARARVTPAEYRACQEAAELYHEILKHESAAQWGVGGSGNRRWDGRHPEQVVDDLTPDWRRRIALLRVVLAIHDERYGHEEAA